LSDSPNKVRKTVFVRDATGLRRALSTFDLFNLVFGQIMPGVGIVFIMGLTPFAFPQSNMGLTFLLAIPLLALGPGLLYGMLGAAIPRTGGDYIYTTRIIHPAFGFLMSWIFVITNLSFISGAGFLFSLEALVEFASTIGQMTSNSFLISNAAWFATSTGELIAGTILIAFITIVVLLGRAVWRLMRVLFVVVMICIVVNIIFLFTVPQSTFVNAFNAQFASQNVTYSGIIQTAVKNGYTPGWTWAGSVGALSFATLGLYGFPFPSYVAGETKNASKTQPLAILSSVLVGGAIFAAWCFAIYSAFGYDFFSAANYLTDVGVAVPIPASVNSLFTVIPQSPVLLFLGAIVFVLAWIWLTPTLFVPVVRSLFAWSFDRLGPAGLADVDDRFHSPVKAVILCGVAGEIMLFLFVYTSFPSLYANTTLLISVVMFFTSIAGLILPWRAKAIFDQSPAWIKRRILGVPSLTWVAGFSTIVMSILLYSCVTNAFTGGSPTSYPFSAGVAIAGLVMYYVAKTYRKRQGIDVTLAFKEIPPE
jgi:APA family basic amino acid/polyamine antiporter